MIDLHTHSTFSDGTMTPEELVRYADKRGVEVLALTDHDTVDGIEPFLAAEAAVERVAGVEISIGYEPGTMHMVGLFIDHKNPFLCRVLQNMVDARRRRNDKLLAMVSDLVGGTVTTEDVNCGNDGELGRPHIAKYLIKAGFAENMDDAFDRYLGESGSMYLEKERVDFHAGVEAIHQAGGLAILAHPLTLEVEEKYLSPFMKYLKGLGLDGMEVWTSDTPPEKYPMMEAIAREQGLAISGGSDFHGDIYLGIGLGTGRSGMNIPRSVYEELRAKAVYK